MTKTKIFTLILSLALLAQVFASCQTAQNETSSPSEEASQNASVAFPSDTEVLPSENPSENQGATSPSEKPSENQDATLPSEEASQNGTEALPSENPSESTADTQPSETPTEEKPTLPEVAVLDEYELLLYMESVGSSSDSFGDVPLYTGEDLYERREYKNKSLPLKIIINGETLHYDNSSKPDTYKDGYDTYFKFIGNSLVTVRYNSITGKMVYYENQAFVANREYVSDVTQKSGEEEFLAYVKKLLREVSDVSVEGWNVSVQTIIYHEDGSKTYERKFVNNSDVDPSFNAWYKYTFSSTIDGIPRYDDVTITVTNVGEMSFLDARVNGNYAPFENVKIDRELLKKIGYTGESNDRIKYCCLANDTELWLQIAPTPPKGEMGRIYLVKLAEIVKNEKEPDEEIKEPSKDNSSPTEEATDEYRVPTFEIATEKIPD